MVMTLAACASQPFVETTTGVPDSLSGLLHCFAAWFALSGHIFNLQIRIYAYPNNGGWYDFGFLLGVSIWGGGAGASARS